MKEKESIVKRIRDGISSYVAVAGKQNFGIESDYVFLSDSSSEDWKNSIKSWGDFQKSILKIIVADAVRKGADERSKYIEELREHHGFTIIIGKNAQEELKAIYAITQVKININAMSDINLQSLAEALEIFK